MANLYVTNSGQTKKYSPQDDEKKKINQVRLAQSIDNVITHKKALTFWQGSEYYILGYDYLSSSAIKIV